MALNFPSSPSTGDIHNASNGLSYFFDGAKWITQGSYNTGTINTIKLDSLTSSFNGSLTTFNLTSNSISVKPANAQSVMISLGGVIQEPTTAYTINSETGTITFASAPASSTAFFGIVYSRLPQSTTTVSDGAITNAKVNATAAIDQSKLNISDATTSASGFMSTSDKTKLDAIEASATADQTAAEIRTLVESATDSNIFTDADHTKLNGIEASATADQTNAEIRAAVEAATDSNVFTDADHTKLNAIEASATADQTASEIVALVADQTIAPSEIDMEDNEKIKLGTADDLSLFHNGTDSKITNITGNLLIEPKDSETGIKVIPDGAVELYHDNVKKAETTSSGVTVSTDGNTSISIQDTGHGLSASQIHLSNGGRDLNITAPKDIRLFPESGELGLVIEASGQVELYHNNVMKLQTSATGVSIPNTLNVGRIIYNQGAELTIADGAITVTDSFHSVDTQGDASTDDLNRINGATDGYVLFLRAADNGRTVVVKDNVAGDAGSTNIQINGDFSLTHVGDVLQLVYYSGHWREVGRSDNNA